MYRFIGLFGLLSMILCAYLLSNNKSKVPWRLVIVGTFLQFVFGLFILKTRVGEWIFSGANLFFNKLFSFSADGIGFLFGPLGNLSVLEKAFGAGNNFIFALQISGTIIFVSALMSALYYLKIMQKIVGAMAWIMQKTMRTSGAETLAASSNIFIGQTEAALIIKPYVGSMTSSELLSLMVGGMATVAGGVMAAYVGMGVSAGHLLSASVMSAPAALVMAKILIPETGSPKTYGTVRLELPKFGVNFLDAVCQGASQGLYLSLNVMGMLVAFIALISLGNYALGEFGTLVGYPLNLQRVFGWVGSPFALAMGVPFQDIQSVGQLLGEKTVINEFVAYLDLAKMQSQLDPRSTTIATYALCGFSNFSSVAIQIGGIGALAPERREDLARLGLTALVGGSLACFMTATIAGMLV